MPAANLLCVCLKPVWRTDVPLRLDAAGHGPRDEEALRATDPAALAALALALSLRATQPALRVLALTVGPSSAERGLRDALAAGADEVLRVWGADWPDAWPPVDASAAVSAAYAGAAAEVLVGRALGGRAPALVLTGERSTDAGHECFGALLAARLGAAFAHRVTALATEVAEGARGTGGTGDVGSAGWRATVRLERGYGQPLTLRAPAVVTVSAQATPPTDAALPAWLASRRAAVPLLTVAGLPPQPAPSALRVPVPRVKHTPLPDRGLSAEQRIAAMVTLDAQGGGVTLAEGTAAEQAEAVLRLLREREYV